MILDRSGLRLLLGLSEEIERVSGMGERVRGILQDPEDSTPEDRTLGEIVSDLEKVQRRVESLISRYPEEIVLEERHR